jgi:hypothetical protein
MLHLQITRSADNAAAPAWDAGGRLQSGPRLPQGHWREALTIPTRSTSRTSSFVSLSNCCIISYWTVSSDFQPFYTISTLSNRPVLFPVQRLMKQHLDKRLIRESLLRRQLPGTLKIGEGQSNRNILRRPHLLHKPLRIAHYPAAPCRPASPRSDSPPPDPCVHPTSGLPVPRFRTREF